MKVYTSIALRSDCKRLAPDNLPAQGGFAVVYLDPIGAVCLPVDSFVGGNGFVRDKKGCFDSYPKVVWKRNRTPRTRRAERKFEQSGCRRVFARLRRETIDYFDENGGERLVYESQPISSGQSQGF